MAQKVQVVLIDDIDGSDATETIAFAFEGKNYTIDLNSAHAAQFRAAMAPYVGHAEPVRGRDARPAGRRTSKAAGPSAGEIRDWAKSQGMTVNERGRIPAEIRQAYDAAN